MAFRRGRAVRWAQVILIATCLLAVGGVVVGTIRPTPGVPIAILDTIGITLAAGGWVGITCGLYLFRLWGRAPNSVEIGPTGLAVTYEDGKKKYLNWGIIANQSVLEGPGGPDEISGSMSNLHFKLKGRSNLWTFRWQPVPVIFLSPDAYEALKIAMRDIGLRLERRPSSDSFAATHDVFDVHGDF